MRLPCQSGIDQASATGGRYQPASVRAPEVEESLRGLAPGAIVIIAYGQIIPARLLGLPKYGWINLHTSLLPKYRGAAPINWAITNGETQTGNTTMRIDAGMDTGEMLLHQELAIGADETAPTGDCRKRQHGGRHNDMGEPIEERAITD